MDPSRLRFNPSGSEGLLCLVRFMAKEEMNDSGFITTNLDVYGEEEPWEIYSQGVASEDDDDYSYRYFITKKCKGENNGSWKQQGQEKFVLDVRSSSPLIMGLKKKMHHVHKFGHWIMKQYELSPLLTCWLDDDRTDYVLCAIKREHIQDCSFHDTSTTTTS